MELAEFFSHVRLCTHGVHTNLSLSERRVRRDIIVTRVHIYRHIRKPSYQPQSPSLCVPSRPQFEVKHIYRQSPGDENIQNPRGIDSEVRHWCDLPSLHWLVSRCRPARDDEKLTGSRSHTMRVWTVHSSSILTSCSYLGMRIMKPLENGTRHWRRPTTCAILTTRSGY